MPGGLGRGCGGTRFIASASTRHSPIAAFIPSLFVPSRHLTPAIGGYPFVSGEPQLGDLARVFWRPDWDKSVLLVRTLPAYSSENAFDLHQYGRWASVLVLEEGFEVVLLTDGIRHLQLFVLEGSVLNGPVYLRYALSGFAHLETRIRSLRRLVGLHQQGQFLTKLYPTETKAERWVQALRAYDGYLAGASQREIAMELFGTRAVSEDWGSGSDYMRLRVRRLLDYAREMTGGAYRVLMR